MTTYTPKHEPIKWQTKQGRTRWQPCLESGECLYRGIATYKKTYRFGREWIMPSRIDPRYETPITYRSRKRAIRIARRRDQRVQRLFGPSTK